MVTIAGSQISCGVIQAYGLTTPEEFLKSIQRDLACGDDYAFCIFSDADYRGRGEQIANYLKQNKLGAITKTRSKINPNSGSKIKVYVWSVPELSELEKFMRNNNIKVVRRPFWRE